jgi:hypothetical protein
VDYNESWWQLKDIVTQTPFIRYRLRRRSALAAPNLAELEVAKRNQASKKELP